jgi:branched-chain amino acid transport system substrate-binding protein
MLDHQTARIVPRGVLLKWAGFVGLALALAGCAGTGFDPFGTPETPPPQEAAKDTIGRGAVKVALILPLSAPNAQVAAQSIRNAAEIALADFSGGQASAENITIIVKDDRGTPEGASAATQEALAEGAELILGPLLAPNVQAAGALARSAGKPVIAFSSDVSVAQRGVYLLSFLPQSDVQRVVTFAGSRGKKSFAALIPQNTYGGVVEAEFMALANEGGRRVALVERYQPGDKASIDQAVQRLKASISSADTLFLPEGAEGLSVVLQSLAAAGITNRSVQFISTGIWNDPRVHAMPVLDGAWFASPDNSRFNAFAARYRSRFGNDPTRIASLGYDAATLISALTQNYGSQRFSEATLLNASGFSGQDGIFRFRNTGLNERGLVVFEIRSGTARPASPAPSSFAAAN